MAVAALRAKIGELERARGIVAASAEEVPGRGQEGEETGNVAGGESGARGGSGRPNSRPNEEEDEEDEEEDHEPQQLSIFDAAIPNFSSLTKRITSTFGGLGFSAPKTIDGAAKRHDSNLPASEREGGSSSNEQGVLGFLGRKSLRLSRKKEEAESRAAEQFYSTNPIFLMESQRKLGE